MLAGKAGKSGYSTARKCLAAELVLIGTPVESRTMVWEGTGFFADHAFAVNQLRRLFPDLDSSALIVDLAEGNGAVAGKPATLSRDHNSAFAISGVDYASVAPSGLKSTGAELVASVEFIGDTDIANLPFHSSIVDCLTSQYGFEYARGNLVLAEAVRVLVADGRDLFIMHAEGGAAREASAARLRRAQSLLQKGQLMMQLDDLAKALKSGSKSRVYKTQQRVDARVAAAQRKHAEIPKDDLVWQISQESREILAAIPQVAEADIAARCAHIRAEVTACAHVCMPCSKHRAVPGRWTSSVTKHEAWGVDQRPTHPSWWINSRWVGRLVPAKPEYRNR